MTAPHGYPLDGAQRGRADLPLPEQVVAVPAVDPVSTRVVSAAWRRPSRGSLARTAVLDALRAVA